MVENECQKLPPDHPLRCMTAQGRVQLQCSFLRLYQTDEQNPSTHLPHRLADPLVNAGLSFPMLGQYSPAAGTSWKLLPSSAVAPPLVLTSQLFSPSSSCEPVSISHVEFTLQPWDTARIFSSSWARLCFQSRSLQLSRGRGFASSQTLPQLITCASICMETLPQHNPHTNKTKQKLMISNVTFHFEDVFWRSR